MNRKNISPTFVTAFFLAVNICLGISPVCLASNNHEERVERFKDRFLTHVGSEGAPFSCQERIDEAWNTNITEIGAEFEGMEVSIQDQRLPMRIHRGLMRIRSTWQERSGYITNRKARNPQQNGHIDMLTHGQLHDSLVLVFQKLGCCSLANASRVSRLWHKAASHKSLFLPHSNEEIGNLFRNEGISEEILRRISRTKYGAQAIWSYFESYFGKFPKEERLFSLFLYYDFHRIVMTKWFEKEMNESETGAIAEPFLNYLNHWQPYAHALLILSQIGHPDAVQILLQMIAKKGYPQPLIHSPLDLSQVLCPCFRNELASTSCTHPNDYDPLKTIRSVLDSTAFVLPPKLRGPEEFEYEGHKFVEIPSTVRWVRLHEYRMRMLNGDPNTSRLVFNALLDECETAIIEDHGPMRLRLGWKLAAKCLKSLAVWSDSKKQRLRRVKMAMEYHARARLYEDGRKWYRYGCCRAFCFYLAGLSAEGIEEKQGWLHQAYSALEEGVHWLEHGQSNMNPKTPRVPSLFCRLALCYGYAAMLRPDGKEKKELLTKAFEHVNTFASLFEDYYCNYHLRRYEFHEKTHRFEDSLHHYGSYFHLEGFNSNIDMYGCSYYEFCIKLTTTELLDAFIFMCMIDPEKFTKVILHTLRYYRPKKKPHNPEIDLALAFLSQKMEPKYAGNLLKRLSRWARKQADETEIQSCLGIFTKSDLVKGQGLLNDPRFKQMRESHLHVG